MANYKKLFKESLTPHYLREVKDFKTISTKHLDAFIYKDGGMKLRINSSNKSPYGYTKRDLIKSPFGVEDEEFTFDYIKKEIDEVYTKFPDEEIKELLDKVDQYKNSLNEEFSSTEQKMINQIKSYKKRGSAMVNLPSKVRDFYFKNKEKIDALNEDLIKEITLAGGNYQDSYGNNPADDQLTTPEDYEIFMEMFPRGEASRILMDPKRKELYDKHLEWTKDSQYNNTFEHMQYHLVKHDGEEYKVHQSQYYNGNYKDFRNPRFTEVMISKDGKHMGTYLVDTAEYIKDLEDLDVQKRVSESLKEDINDPVLVKARAAKMAVEKEKAKQASLDKKYGSSFMNKLDAELDLKAELEDLEQEREMLMIDMEQEAEPEGGEIADRYGERLNQIDMRIADIQEELDDLRMYESVDEGTCGYGEDGKVDPENTSKLKPSKSKMSDKEIDAEVRRLLKRNFMEEEIETSLTPNEIGDEAVEKEADSAAYESLQESLRRKLQDRLK